MSEFDLDAIMLLRTKYRRDGLAAFSTNWRGKTWHFKTWGLTPEEKRHSVRGSQVVSRLARVCRNERKTGGRFFVGRDGAYYKNHDGQIVQFVRFEFE